jgi:superfamily II DNA/RNA helicase
VQTLLFSATLPSWVKEITKRFLKPGFKTVDLVGSEKMKVGRRQPDSSSVGQGGLRQVHPG